jgi:hypothetical protein
MIRLFAVIFAAFLLFALPQDTFGMGTEDFGNAPLNEGNYGSFPGVMGIVNHTTRVYHWWCNGNEMFFFRGDVDQLNDALEQFSASEAEEHLVVIRPATGDTKTFKDEGTVAYNWSFQLVGGISRGHPEKLTGSKSPVLTIELSDEIPLDKLKLPRGVTLKPATEKTIAETSAATADAAKVYAARVKEIEAFCNSRVK